MQEREATGVRLPFADRQEAGRLLGRALAARPERADAIVLAIPRGGVPVAAAMASGLGLPLDVLVAHKLGAPSDPEVAIGAVAADGTIRIEAWARELVGRDEAYLERAAEDEIARARAREAAIRGARPRPDLAGRTVILVDDGIATGATMHVG
ncbi:MAG TPA: phosphoribosyltransferase family protein, partial [Candidatus Limnocylindrales bacterium]